ncbi:MAG: YobH family protein [Pseudomonadota bacterium]
MQFGPLLVAMLTASALYGGLWASGYGLLMGTVALPDERPHTLRCSYFAAVEIIEVQYPYAENGVAGRASCDWIYSG